MLCVNCDQPMPEGAEACPTCGAHRLELMVSPASEASLKPPRRHRAATVVVLLLCVGIVAALAGQAYLTHPGGSSPPAQAAAKAKHKGKATPAPTPASLPGGLPTQDPTSNAPAPKVVGVYVGPVPDGMDPNAPVAAVRDAMRAWGAQGLDLEAADPGSADVAVRFVEDAADASTSGPGTAVVALGDKQCGGAWRPYASASVTALAERALGQAMGRDGPSGAGDLMDPNLKVQYDPPCRATQGSLSIDSGKADGKKFHLAAASTVSYTVKAQPGYVDACILTPDEWDSFAAGDGGGVACRYSTQDDSNSASLDAGDYILGFRCNQTGWNCNVDYTLSAT